MAGITLVNREETVEYGYMSPAFFFFFLFLTVSMNLKVSVREIDLTKENSVSALVLE